MKRILALILLLLSIIAIAEPALARPGGSSGGQWETITVTLQSLVSSIGEFLDFTDIENGDTVVRGAFFLLLFIMFYAAGIRAFGQLTTEKSEGKETTWAAVAAFLVSLIVVILTPEGLIVTFLSQFGIFFWVALYFILYAGVLWFLYVFLPSFVGSDDKNKGINKFGARLLSGSRVIFSLLAISMLQEFEGSFVRVSSSGLPQANLELLRTILNQMNGYILIIFSIILIYELFRLFTAGAADDRFKDDSSGSIFSGLGNSASSAASSVSDRTKDLANSALDKAKDKARGSVEGVGEDAVEEAIDDTVEAVSGKEDEERDRVSDADEGVRDWEKGLEDVSSLVPEAEDALNALHRLYSKIKSEVYNEDIDYGKVEQWGRGALRVLQGKSAEHSIEDYFSTTEDRLDEALTKGKELFGEMNDVLKGAEEEKALIEEVRGSLDQLLNLKKSAQNHGAVHQLEQQLDSNVDNFGDETRREMLFSLAGRVEDMLPPEYDVDVGDYEIDTSIPDSDEEDGLKQYVQDVYNRQELARDTYESLIGWLEEAEELDESRLAMVETAKNILESDLEQLENLRENLDFGNFLLKQTPGADGKTVHGFLREKIIAFNNLVKGAKNEDKEAVREAVDNLDGFGGFVDTARVVINRLKEQIDALHTDDLDERWNQVVSVTDRFVD
jgi:hypothetical protein